MSHGHYFDRQAVLGGEATITIRNGGTEVHLKAAVVEVRHDRSSMDLKVVNLQDFDATPLAKDTDEVKALKGKVAELESKLAALGIKRLEAELDEIESREEDIRWEEI